ncbi:MAG: glutathione S-transferase family protein [Proteobacteria bacterium]|nr:glutathione S-transferase family protein [Pseudomonadota bacterium]
MTQPMPITLYTHPWSRGRIARWMLEETGLPYEVRLLEYGTTMKAPDYTAINPMGKVPALTVGDTVVTEAAAICAFLAERVPDRQLAPPPLSPARAPYYRWLFFAAGPVEAAVTAKALGLLAPEDKRTTAGYGTYDDVMTALERVTSEAVAHGGGYIAGGRFSAADLYLAAQLNWGMQFKTIAPRAAFERYVEPLVRREACVRANRLDDELAQTLKPKA